MSAKRARAAAVAADRENVRAATLRAAPTFVAVAPGSATTERMRELAWSKSGSAQAEPQG
jgi:hypothetical protein